MCACVCVLAFMLCSYRAMIDSYTHCQQELRALERVGNHACVVSYIGTARIGDALALITDYMSRGSLLAVLRQAKEDRPTHQQVRCNGALCVWAVEVSSAHGLLCWFAVAWLVAWWWLQLVHMATQAAAGVTHLHSEGVVHRCCISHFLAV